MCLVEVEGVKVKVLRSSVGAITESDIVLANASNAIIIGFNIRPNNSIKDYAKEQGVEIIFEDEQFNEEMFGLYAWFNERRARDDSKNIRRNYGFRYSGYGRNFKMSREYKKIESKTGTGCFAGCKSNARECNRFCLHLGDRKT